MAGPFEVRAYSIGTLEDLLAKKSGTPVDIIHNKNHSRYFEDYFGHLGAGTILVENDYVDRDFLEDFAGYYVRCFYPYQRKCTRLHFFTGSLTEKDFEQIIASQLTDAQVSSLQARYLGFVVVKPLRQTVVGRTCLATYEEEGRRFYPTARPYGLNLFGIPLRVKTLEFQEQDKVAAACATTALWSVFHKTAELFQHHLLSPVEITRAAHLGGPMAGRVLPSPGLDARQMARAICSVGLEAITLPAQDEYKLKAALYGYVQFGIPALLMLDIYDVLKRPHERIGRHAVAVTGYSLGIAAPEPYGPTGFLLKASRMDKLYVHDDQVGPFARMVFDGTTVSLRRNGETITLWSLSTSWRARRGGGIRAVPDLMLVPVYHKIRIPFELILKLVLGFDAILGVLHGARRAPLRSRPEWDIRLCSINEVKHGGLLSAAINHGQRKEIALTPMPRFLWRARACAEDVPILDLLFDATDVEQGHLICRAIEYDLPLGRFLRGFAKQRGLRQVVEEVVETEPERRILDWFKDQPL